MDCPIVTLWPLDDAAVPTWEVWRKGGLIGSVEKIEARWSGKGTGGGYRAISDSWGSYATQLPSLISAARWVLARYRRHAENEARRYRRKVPR